MRNIGAISPQVKELHQSPPNFEGNSEANLDAFVESGSACRTSPEGPETFYSDDPGDIAVAKAICRGCPVVKECLILALERREQHGVWGATTAKERGWTDYGNRTRAFQRFRKEQRDDA